MKSNKLLLLVFLFCGVGAARAQEMCPPRPTAGSVVVDPVELRSQNGKLTVDLTMLNSAASDGTMQYCYVYGDGSLEAPTLVVNQGDTLIFNLTNHLTPIDQAAPHKGAHGMPAMMPSTDPCAGKTMNSASTNVHFHGLNVPPKCHQDDVIRTSIASGDPPFTFKIKIPANEPPGLYWYHPHPHGFTKTQVIGGGSGALIVNGLEKLRPEVSGLPERVFVVRQKFNPGGGDDASVPSINFVPFHLNLYARILTKPLERQLWRVLNSSSTQFLQLQLLNQGVPTKVKLVGLDGVPLSAARVVDTVVIPPAGRAEFIMQGPARNGLLQFLNAGFDTGPGGDFNPARLLANVLPDNTGTSVRTMPVAHTTDTLRRFAGLTQQTPNKKRHLYFSETDDGTQFFITVVGQPPKIYEPNDPPAIVARQGTVEDLTIENRSTEVHAFHLHQLHFVVLDVNGKPTDDDAIRDTVLVPYWDGVSPTYPSIKIRVDFRDPEVVGTFLYHCHILDHEDGGMMAKIRVVPAK